MFVGIICSLVAMADDVTFGLTQAIDTENKTIGAVSYTGTTNVTNSGVQNGSKVDSYKATGANRSVQINGTAYTSDSQWRKNENTSGYTTNQWTGYSLTVATGYKLNITGVHAMLSVADDTYTWKVSILDASDQVLYESQDKTTKKASTTDFTLNYASLPEATKAKLTGITGTIKVRVYMYQGGSTKYFAIPYLTITGNVEESNTQSYEVTATAAPVAGGIVSGDGSWEEGKNVSLTATPNKGYKFVKWTIDEKTTSTDNPYVISSIAAAHSAVATFEALPKITYTLGEGAGVVPAVDYAEVGANVTLPSVQTQLIYKEGYTMTGWTDGENTYAIGAQVPVTGDMTFAAVFEENQAAIGDGATTVDWNFKTSTGAPAGAFEGNIGYYAKKATINEKSVDVIMKINTETGAAFPETRGKWNTVADANRAQVNKGTILTIPAISGMVVTMTITNGTASADMFTFNGEQGEANESAKTVSYTYNGAAATLDIIDQGKNTYPAGLSVVYPVAQTGEESDLAIASATANVNKDKTATVAYTTTSTGTVTATSSKSSVATAVVDGNNIVITGVAAGTATITVSQEADETYKSGEKTITVTVTDPTAPTLVAKWDASDPIGEWTYNSTNVTVTTVKINTNTKTVNAIKCGSSIFKDGVFTHYAKVVIDGGFKAGDIVKISGVYNTDGEKEAKIAVATDDATSTEDFLYMSDIVINGRTEADDPSEYTFTLTKDCDHLCVGRGTGGTSLFITSFTVSRAATLATPTIGQNGYSTYCSDYAFTVAGATAYKATCDGETVTLEEISGAIPAGEGVILKGTEGETATITYAASAPAVEGNALKGVNSETTGFAEGANYVLASNGTQTAFVNMSAGKVVAEMMNKAYLNIPATAGVKPVLFFSDDNATAVAGVEEAKAEVKAIKFVKNGQLLIKTANGIVNAAAAQVK